MHLFAEPSLGPDAEAIADQQHADQQFGIDGGAARVAVELRKMRADAAKIDEPVDGAQQVILWDMILKRELVEQRRLRFLSWSHHRRSSPSITGIESAVQTSIKEEFFNKISPKQTYFNRAEQIDHCPSIPRNLCAPRLSKIMPDPATKSRTVCETRTWPASAIPPIRAAM
ncbi:hypothetical protein PEL8287_03903 [Roseovarius litorisediminis]|uniref:Uncharacterized protein n=1 Tax=Roseovarius litorisediminis TaxID=1312363 RepID=A0A1Y5TS98_9RHOB|nr:hypothetical protein PEL8287_03903 [Roseovarius litorisediminis]